MDMRPVTIGGIPAIIWGPETEGLFIAVHGSQSNKADAVIAIFAEEAIAKGYQVLSFDLPEHGDRKGGPVLCKPPACTADLKKVLRYARARASDIGLFGCSMGAYFGMLAYADEPIRQALFLSPVVDMKRIIQNMMLQYGVSEERLKQEQEISTPFNMLYWDYYRYVLSRPVQWDAPAAILYGTKDFLCEREAVESFAEKAGARLTTLENGEHFFHTEAQLAFFREWLRESIR